MIYCVWYPSGGFGHFINGILTLHGKDFKRPSQNLTFSSTGDSHNLDLIAPRYSKNTDNYHYNFNSNYNYSVLIDLGIDSTRRDFMQSFPGATVIKMCYTDVSWPVVAKTMIHKAMRSSIESELVVDPTLWSSTESWTQREKYFLFLRDHHFRRAWQTESNINCILIDSLINYSKLKSALEQSGPELTEFSEVWNQWYISNEQYFLPIIKAKQVINNINSQENIDLTDITDIWTQAVIYYFIWLEFGQEVPHNDFENFFTDVDEIRTWLHQ
jgi:hypothetical protein